MAATPEQTPPFMVDPTTRIVFDELSPQLTRKTCDKWEAHLRAAVVDTATFKREKCDLYMEMNRLVQMSTQCPPDGPSEYCLHDYLGPIFEDSQVPTKDRKGIFLRPDYEKILKVIAKYDRLGVKKAQGANTEESRARSSKPSAAQETSHATQTKSKTDVGKTDPVESAAANNKEAGDKGGRRDERKGNERQTSAEERRMERTKGERKKGDENTREKMREGSSVKGNEKDKEGEKAEQKEEKKTEKTREEQKCSGNHSGEKASGATGGKREENDAERAQAGEKDSDKRKAKGSGAEKKKRDEIGANKGREKESRKEETGAESGKGKEKESRAERKDSSRNDDREKKDPTKDRKHKEKAEGSEEKGQEDKEHKKKKNRKDLPAEEAPSGTIQRKRIVSAPTVPTDAEDSDAYVEDNEDQDQLAGSDEETKPLLKAKGRPKTGTKLKYVPPPDMDEWMETNAICITCKASAQHCVFSRSLKSLGHRSACYYCYKRKIKCSLNVQSNFDLNTNLGSLVDRIATIKAESVPENGVPGEAPLPSTVGELLMDMLMGTREAKEDQAELRRDLSRVFVKVDSVVDLAITHHVGLLEKVRDLEAEVQSLHRVLDSKFDDLKQTLRSQSHKTRSASPRSSARSHSASPRHRSVSLRSQSHSSGSHSRSQSRSPSPRPPPTARTPSPARQISPLPIPRRSRRPPSLSASPSPPRPQPRSLTRPAIPVRGPPPRLPSTSTSERAGSPERTLQEAEESTGKPEQVHIATAAEDRAMHDPPAAHVPPSPTPRQRGSPIVAPQHSPADSTVSPGSKDKEASGSTAAARMRHARKLQHNDGTVDAPSADVPRGEKRKAPPTKATSPNKKHATGAPAKKNARVAK